MRPVLPRIAFNTLALKAAHRPWRDALKNASRADFAFF